MKYKVNQIRQQNADQNSCGSFTINFVLDRLVNKKTFKEATNYNSKDKNIQEREHLVLRGGGDEGKFPYI